VLEIDPQSLAVRRVAGAAGAAGMQGVSVGLKVGEEIWVGNFSGDRIGYLPAQ
jgi:hypothetical protein